MYVLAQKSFWLAQNIFFDETKYFINYYLLINDTIS